MHAIIGKTTTYHGTEHRYLAGYAVRIVGVIKGGAAPDRDPDADCAYLWDDLDIDRAGGIGPNDRVEVQPWLAGEGRFSFVASDPRAIDLACFAHLAR